MQPADASKLLSLSTTVDKFLKWAGGGMFVGVPVKTAADVIAAGRAVGMSPLDALRALETAMSPTAAVLKPPLGGNTGSIQGRQLCQFTICFNAHNIGPDPARLLLDRLRMPSGIPAAKLHNVHIYAGADKTVVVAFKENSEHVVFEDETNLFPSDKLVAAFHLLLKAL